VFLGRRQHNPQTSESGSELASLAATDRQAFINAALLRDAQQLLSLSSESRQDHRKSRQPQRPRTGASHGKGGEDAATTKVQDSEQSKLLEKLPHFANFNCLQLERTTLSSCCLSHSSTVLPESAVHSAMSSLLL
jgi:hypothetical protein